MEKLINFLRFFLFCMITATISLSLENIFAKETFALQKILSWGGGTCVALFLLSVERWLYDTISVYILFFPLLGVFLGHHLSLLFAFWSPHRWDLYFPEVTALVNITITATIFYMSIIFSSHLGKSLSENTKVFHMLTQKNSKKNKWILDLSALLDPRTTSLALSGLFNDSLSVDSYLSKQLHLQLDSGNECMKTKAKHAIQNLEKLQMMPDLNLDILHTAPADPNKDTLINTLQLAKELGLGVLTADSPKIPLEYDQVQVLSLQQLAHILKPLFQLEGPLRIKIQRVGKEPNQGVGYLEDGTMVVVNNAGSRVGHLVEAQVLSTKNTCAGRIVFCNCNDEDIAQSTIENEETENTLLAGEPS